MRNQNCFFIAIILICVQLLANKINAQVTQVKLQAAGLTCSMCAKSIFKSLKTLSFVDDVQTEIKSSTFTIILRKGEVVDYDALAKKVKSAGFTVAKLWATLPLANQELENDKHLDISGVTYHFVNTNNKKVDGDVEVMLLDKNFTSAKVNKKYQVFTKLKCYQTGTMENCCSATNGETKKRIYHVTI